MIQLMCMLYNEENKIALRLFRLKHSILEGSAILAMDSPGLAGRCRCTYPQIKDVFIVNH
jgi:hypothetical protein